MTRFSMLLLASILASPVFISAPASAMDPGTYRPGMAYDSITSKDPSMCEAQCSGDAQCRGWNFVKINPNAPIGVCEFNAQAAAPVPSVYSISGENSSAVRSATIIPGRSNTVRVGSISAPAAQQKSPTRRIVRQPVPQNIQTRSAAHRGVPTPRPVAPRANQRPAPSNFENLSLTEQQNLQRRGTLAPMQRSMPQPQRRPQFQHNLEGRAIAPNQSPPRPSVPHAARQVPPSAQRPTPSVDPRLQQRLIQQQRMQGAQPPTGQMQYSQKPSPSTRQSDPRLSPTGQAYPPSNISNPNAPTPNAAMQRPQTYPQQVQQQRAYAPQRAPQRPVVNVAAELSPQRPMTAAQAEQSLFGSLYDDVKVPRPINPAAFAANPDAPIPTVANVPVRPVQVGPLPQAIRKAGPPAPQPRSGASGLAGGMN